MVSRGPQFVQLVKAYRYRRSRKSKISRSHSGQVARSGGIDTCRSPAPPSLGTITKSETASSGISRDSISRVWISLISAAGGACVRSRSEKTSKASGDPNTSISTPRESFQTRPPTPDSRAFLSTQARNPTPATRPRPRTPRPAPPPLNGAANLHPQPQPLLRHRGAHRKTSLHHLREPPIGTPPCAQPPF